jgi:nucleoside-diphosphate-sugar epimerase
MGDGRVLVTGVTGYIAGHCVRELLAHGYDVRGTVRDLAADVSHLAPFTGSGAGGSFELARARLESDEGWDQAAEGCDYLWHLAAPVPAGRPGREEEFLRPIVDGTRRALAAAARAGVRRVVYTSSIEAVIHNRATAHRVRTEQDWSDPAECGVYARAKLQAERAAWDLAAEHGLELVTLLPGGVNGPLLRYDRPTTGDVPRWMLSGKMPVVPKVDIDVTDVRDLAVAHRLATEVPAAAGNRYICASEPVRLGEIAAILAAEYGPRGFPVSTRPLPSWVLRALSHVSADMRLISSLAGPKRVSSEKARTELGWTQRPVRDSIIDNAEDLIAHGIVTPKTA